MSNLSDSVNHHFKYLKILAIKGGKVKGGFGGRGTFILTASNIGEKYRQNKNKLGLSCAELSSILEILVLLN